MTDCYFVEHGCLPLSLSTGSLQGGVCRGLRLTTWMAAPKTATHCAATLMRTGSGCSNHACSRMCLAVQSQRIFWSRSGRAADRGTDGSERTLLAARRRTACTGREPRELAVRVVDSIYVAAGRCARRRAARRPVDAALCTTGSWHCRRLDGARSRCGLFNAGAHSRCPRARQARSRHAQWLPVAATNVAQASRRLPGASALVLADGARGFAAIEEHCEERGRAYGFIASRRHAEPADGLDAGLDGSGLGTTALERQGDRQGHHEQEDALLAVAHGADGVVVSNHGGRQLGSTFAPLELLPGIVAAVRGKTEIFIDGGVRRGSDALKAVALGARGALLGRAPLYGSLRAEQPGPAKCSR